MKYRGARALSSSVAVWLEQQLEERGIDSHTYSRYIVNLLQDDSFDFCDSPKLNKGCSKKRIRNNWKNSDLEFLKKSAVVECLKDASDQASGIENLVEELYRKLKQADCEGDLYLKEKTNSEDIFNLELPVSSPSTLAHKYYSVFPALSVENSSGDCFYQSSIWNKARCFPRRKDSEGSPKDCRSNKRKEGNKENVCLRGRMRSRSTVKQATHHRNRTSMAKSLDRKDNEATPKFLRSKHSELKTRKCLNFFGQNEMEATSKLSRTPGRRDKFEEAIEFDQDLPVDFQQLLQSPDESSSRYFKQASQKALASHPHANFIQCGTNITSSIWSEKMEDDTLPEIQETFQPTWEPPVKANEDCCSQRGNKYVEWSDARTSLLSSAWKLPFAYGNLIENKKEGFISDIEKTILNFGNEGSFYSFFGGNGPKISFTTKSSEPSESPLKKVVPSVNNGADDCLSNQEEDLLTSMKTHFRPIKQDRCDPGTSSEQKYIDGSTFVLSTSLEEVDFRRSESGSLYIGNNKYMEFKSPYQPPLLQKSEFVPKFKVQQNEKFCQTDDTCFSGESECMDKDDDKCEFYFPGDDRLAEDMVNCVVDEDDSGVETTPSITVNGWVTAWPISSCSGIWSHNSEGNSKPWILDGVNSGGKESNDNGGEHYLRLRHELTEDGEELLSDLSSIHLFLDADRIEEPSPHIQCFSGVPPKNTRNPTSIVGRRKSFEQTVLLRPNQKERKRRHSSSSRQGCEKVGKHLLQSLAPLGIRPLSF